MTLRAEMRVLAIRTREKLHLTQRQMAELLIISESSYSDIETGHSGCCSLTLMRLLALQEKPTDFIRDINAKLEQIYTQEVLLA